RVGECPRAGPANVGEPCLGRFWYHLGVRGRAQETPCRERRGSFRPGGLRRVEDSRGPQEAIGSCAGLLTFSEAARGDCRPRVDACQFERMFGRRYSRTCRSNFVSWPVGVSSTLNGSERLEKFDGRTHVVPRL